MTFGNPIDAAVTVAGRQIAVTARKRESGELIERRADRADAFLTTIAAVIEGLGGTATDLARLWVDRGPGSYTGLRVTLAAARTLAAVSSIEVRTFTSFERIAEQHWASSATVSSPIRIALDARRQRVYTAVMQCIDGTPTYLEPAHVIEETTFVETLETEELPLVVSGDEPPPTILVAGENESIQRLRAPEGSATSLLCRVVASSSAGGKPLDPRDTESWQPAYMMGTYADQ